MLPWQELREGLHLCVLARTTTMTLRTGVCLRMTWRRAMKVTATVGAGVVGAGMGRAGMAWVGGEAVAVL